MCIIISPLCLDMFLRTVEDVLIFSIYLGMYDEKCIEIPEFGKNDHIDW